MAFEKAMHLREMYTLEMGANLAGEAHNIPAQNQEWFQKTGANFKRVVQIVGAALPMVVRSSVL